MRKTYLDNVRWITVVLVVIYHVIYMFNGVTKYGVIGPFCDVQFQDTFLYLVYPWFMLLLFVVSGMAARFELETKAPKDFFEQEPENCWCLRRLASSSFSGSWDTTIC